MVRGRTGEVGIGVGLVDEQFYVHQTVRGGGPENSHIN